MGDVVQLQSKGGDVNQSPGYIQEVRGRGWYTIQVFGIMSFTMIDGDMMLCANTVVSLRVKIGTVLDSW